MIRLCLALAAGLVLALSGARAAGLSYLHIPGGPDGPAIEAAMWSPCAAPPQELKIGALTMPAVPDCPIAGDNLPLVVVSHGYGGWYVSHHDTAEALADAGFVVVALNHPHANRTDMSRANGLPVLIRRPADIRRTIDFMLGDFPGSGRIDPDRIGFYGFSQGGYTGLVVAGAAPDFGRLAPRCADPKAVGCPPEGERRPRRPLPAELSRPGALTRDDRIRAMVVADPLSAVFQTAESVKAVTIPLQIWRSGHGGGSGATPEDLDRLIAVLPGDAEVRRVPNALHQSFLTVCPKIDPLPAICKDAPGFDRAAFHRDFNAEVIAFFRRRL